MSKAGQNTITGINRQLDVALLYLLKNYKYENFVEITLEGNEWEDFTLFFNDKIDSFEVKWHQSITFNDVQKIISKELSKNTPHKYNFFIVCKIMGADFKNAYEKLRKVHCFINENMLMESCYQQTKIFHEKGWSLKELTLLANTIIIEKETEDKLNEEFYNHFLYNEEIFLEEYEVDLMFSYAFKDIINKASTGESITREEFLECLRLFKHNLARRSESFSPELIVGKKIENLTPYLRSAEAFGKLNSDIYLTAISMNGRLIQDISSQISNKRFPLDKIYFWIDKILSKKGYYFIAVSIFVKSEESGIFNLDVFLKFATDCYENIYNSPVAYEILKTLLFVLKNNKTVEYAGRIYEFVNAYVLPYTTKPHDEYFDDRAYINEALAKLLNEVNDILNNDDEYLALLFDNYVFVKSDFGVSSNANKEYSKWIQEYLVRNFPDNFEKVFSCSIEQFVRLTEGRYQGAELNGAFFGTYNDEVSLSDSAIVQDILAPAILASYRHNKIKTWEFIKQNLLIESTNEVDANHPTFLIRSLVPLLVLISSDESDEDSSIKTESYNQLKIIAAVTGGLPTTSDSIFNCIKKIDTGSNMKKGDLNVEELIIIALNKHGGIYLESPIIMDVLVKNIESCPAKVLPLILTIFKQPDFKNTYNYRIALSLIGKDRITFMEKTYILQLMDIILSCNDNDILSDDEISLLGKALVVLINLDLEVAKRKFVDISMKLKDTHFDCFGNLIKKLSQQKPIETYDLISELVSDNEELESLIKISHNFTSGLIELSNQLRKEKEYDKTIYIINILLKNKDFMSACLNAQYDKSSKIINGDDILYAPGQLGELILVLESLVYCKEDKIICYALDIASDLCDNSSKVLKEYALESPLYTVLVQAIHVLGAISHVISNTDFNKRYPNEYSSLKNLSLKIVAKMRGLHALKHHPVSIVYALLTIFDRIRDLSKEEIYVVLDMFRSFDLKESAGLFIYYAFFDKSNSMGDKEVESKLQEICNSKSELRVGVAKQFYVQYSRADNNFNREHMLTYFPMFLEPYQRNVYYFIYHMLEMEIDLNDDFSHIKELLYKALSIEVDHLSKNKLTYPPSILIRQMAASIYNYSPNEFLEFFDYILTFSDFKLGYTLFEFDLHELTDILKDVEIDDENTVLYESIVDKLNSLSIDYLTGYKKNN
jgi:hypothetical protein